MRHSFSALTAGVWVSQNLQTGILAALPAREKQAMARRGRGRHTTGMSSNPVDALLHRGEQSRQIRGLPVTPFRGPARDGPVLSNEVRFGGHTELHACDLSCILFTD